MLSLNNIYKIYGTGNNQNPALNGVSLEFREHEFVSILGPSGCGKTTLLNIIGGLDQYTDGDLVINHVSTKKYKDADWDTYRNHSIGFVFQSYNLIPHQTVLANVELALTLSGISKKERRSRAIEALKQVGLGNHLRKKPNQMSGGQMQRVAIARALVNDPDILLADEPTGALDTATSVQIMEILREISKDKLIIMVTHNPDLAAEYSSRIIKLLDGKIVDDSDPYHMTEEEEKAWADAQKEAAAAPKTREKKKGKKSMSLFTALSLSLNNLLTKKGRTFMTSFAGSIGIIGIALILSVSTGVNNYINAIQRDTLASYPIQLHAEEMDMTSLITTLMQTREENEAKERDPDKVYESAVVAELMNSLNTAKTNTNDLTAFKKHIDAENSPFNDYLTAVQYGYDFDWNMLTKDADGKTIRSDVKELFQMIMGGGSGSSSGSSLMMGSGSSGFDVWQEALKGKDGEAISSIIKDEYDLLYGEWPKNYNEIMLVVNERNEISDLSLFALGLRTQNEILEGILAASKGEVLDMSELGSWTYEELCNMEFRLVLNSEAYQKTETGYVNLTETQDGLGILYANGIPLKITAIIRPNEDATSTVLSGTLIYTSALTEYAIEKTASNELLKSQLNTPTVDVITGLPFRSQKTMTDSQKNEAFHEYLNGLSTDAEKAAFCREVLAIPSEAEVLAAADRTVTAMTGDVPDAILQFLIDEAIKKTGLSEEMIRGSIEQMYPTTEERRAALVAGIAEMTRPNLITAKKAELALTLVSDTDVLAAFDAKTYTDAEYAAFYDEILDSRYSDSSYEENLELLGYVNIDAPASISLYANTFEDKDRIADLIRDYNNGVEEEQQISYTDYVALMMSSITTIINAISYVLIAFVAISLVVSSIMIGIITYISVLERTKEIGILRAIGASKRDVGRVFNAETLIVGFVAGMIGIFVSLFFIVIINIILYHFTGIAALKATLPVSAAIILVGISMFLTLVAGLFPSRFAAKRNPVEALRSE